MGKNAKKQETRGRKSLPAGEKKRGVTVYIKESALARHGGRPGVAAKLAPVIAELETN